MKKIRFHKNALLFLDELTDILIEKAYFSFYNTSVMYIEDIVSYITGNIETAPHKEAPPYFSRLLGNNLYYIQQKQANHLVYFL